MVYFYVWQCFWLPPLACGDFGWSQSCRPGEVFFVVVATSTPCSQTHAECFLKDFCCLSSKPHPRWLLCWLWTGSRVCQAWWVCGLSRYSTVVETVQETKTLPSLHFCILNLKRKQKEKKKKKAQTTGWLTHKHRGTNIFLLSSSLKNTTTCFGCFTFDLKCITWC